MRTLKRLAKRQQKAPFTYYLFIIGWSIFFKILNNILKNTPSWIFSDRSRTFASVACTLVPFPSPGEYLLNFGSYSLHVPMIIVCMLGSSFSCLCKILFILDKFEIKENNLFGMEAPLILQIQDLSHDITLAEMMCVIQFFIVV